MRYIGGDAGEAGCIFCNRLTANDDVASLIVHRGEHCFAIMNLYPYNTGHVMIVPNTHVANIDELTAETLTEMALLLPVLTRALRRVLNCDGFNIGLNIGSVAGAGVADHLHEHVVPRWEGDANFMPIIGDTMVLPELIPATYAKLRAELEHDLHHIRQLEVVIVDDREADYFWLLAHAFPTVKPEPDTPLWESVVSQLSISNGEIVGWSGASDTRERGVPAGLIVRGSINSTDDRWTRVPNGSKSEQTLLEPVRATLNRIDRRSDQHERAPQT
jgi:ATP adenylyltransferase